MADGTDHADPQARFVAADVAGVRVISVYVPNGGAVGSDKWDYKMEWLSRLRSYLDAEADPAKPMAVCGDFNVAPDDHDVNNPEKWKDSVLCHPDARAAFRELIEWGLVDAFAPTIRLAVSFRGGTTACSALPRTTACASTPYW